jgi:hypothetical protein
MARQRVVHKRATAAIGHMHHFNAGALRQQYHCQMTKAAAADRSIGDAVGLCFSRRNDIRECLERTFWMGCDDVGRGADQQHRFKVLLGVKRKVLQEGIDRMSVEHEYPVAAIRRGLRDLRGADAAGGARFVLNTMMVPSRCCSPGCTIRAIGSTVPPGGNGTTIRVMLPVAGWLRAD